MSQDKQQAQILKLYHENIGQHKIHDTMLSDIETVLTDEFCYISELLQNANDAQAKVFSMQIIGDYLVYTNDGHVFQESHVERICNYSGRHKHSEQSAASLPSEDKVNNIHKIGHKDVGFKSVFKFSDCAYILSGGYSFRFDATHPWNDVVQQQPPWMITPIWTPLNDFPETVRPHLQSNTTQFIFRIKPDYTATLQAAIQSIIQNKEILLFLDSIKQVNISLEHNTQTQTITREIEGKLIHLRDRQNQHKSQKWYTESYTFPIPSAVRKELQSMSQFACPKKVKESENATIVFALPIHDNNEIENIRSKSVLFTHLPTQQRCKLPFQVSAVFLLDKSRQNLLKNSYNSFLFHAIGYLQFKLAETLSSGPLWKQVLHAIGYSADCTEESCSTAFNEGLKQGANTIKILPSFFQGAENITLAQAVSDPTDTVYKFSFANINVPNLIHGSILSKHLIHKYKYGRELEHQEIFTIVENNERQLANDLHLYARILRHFFDISSSALTIGIKNRKIFLRKEGVLCKAGDLFIPEEKKESIFESIELPRISLQAYQMLTRDKKNDVDAWLQQCGVHPSSYANIISQYLENKIPTLKTTESIYLSILQYLYSAFRDHYTLSAHRRLQSMPVFTMNQLRPVRSCLFSQPFPTAICYQGKIKDDVFLSEVYLRLDVENPSQVMNFFKALGLREQITYREETISVGTLKEWYPNLANDYLASIRDKHIKKIMDTHQLVNFSHIDHILLMTTPGYQELFFEILVKNWRKIGQAERNSMYKMSSKNIQIRPFLAFFLTEKAQVRTTSGTIMPLNQTYQPSYSIFNDPLLPVACMDAQINEEQIQYLGLLRHLSFNDIVRLLTTWASLPLDDVALEKYSVLYRSMIHRDYEEDLTALRTLNLSVPAADQTHQPLSQIQCFAAFDETVPCSSKWMKQLPNFSREDMILFSSKLGINIVNQFDVKFEEDYREQYDPPLNQLKKIIPYFALYLNKHTFKDPKKHLSDWAPVIARLKIFYANRIINLHDDSHITRVHYNTRLNELTYTEHWNKGDTLRTFSKRVTEKMLQVSVDYSVELSDLIKIDSEKDLSTWMLRNRFTQEVINDLSAFWHEQLMNNAPIIENSSNPKQKNKGLKIKIKLRKEESLGAKQLAEFFSEKRPATSSADFSAIATTPKKPNAALDNAIEIDHATQPETPQSTKTPKTPSDPTNTQDILKKLLLKSPASSDPKRTLFNRIDKDEESGSPSSEPSKKKKAKTSSAKSKSRNEKIKPVVPLSDVLNLHTPLSLTLSVNKLGNSLANTPASSTKKSTGSMSAVNSMKEKAVDQKTRDQIGVFGESICYRHLHDHYLTKYQKIDGDAKSVDLPMGFRIENGRGELLLQVEWYDKPYALNKSSEKSTTNYDIQVYKPSNQKITYIEVKSTIAKNKRSFQLSSAELAALNTYGDRYRFYRVLSAYTQSPVIEKIKNPKQLIEEDKISVEINSVSVSYKPEIVTYD